MQTAAPLDAQIVTRVSRKRRDRYERRAKQFGLSLSAYVRAVLDAADRRTCDPVVALDDGRFLKIVDGGKEDLKLRRAR